MGRRIGLQDSMKELKQWSWNVHSRLQDIHYVTIKQRRRAKRTKYSKTPTLCSHILLCPWIYASFPILYGPGQMPTGTKFPRFYAVFLMVHTKTKNQGFTIYTILINYCALQSYMDTKFINNVQYTCIPKSLYKHIWSGRRNVHGPRKKWRNYRNWRQNKPSMAYTFCGW